MFAFKKSFFYLISAIALLSPTLLNSEIIVRKIKKRSEYNHGSYVNKLIGGSCREFFYLNDILYQCDKRDDDCFINDFDTKCFCDEYCFVRGQSKDNDCCKDVNYYISDIDKKVYKTNSKKLMPTNYLKSLKYLKKKISHKNSITPKIKSFIYKHDSPVTENKAGSCKEFLKINYMTECCLERDDDCYMNHYDSRCYCDKFCDRSYKSDYSDCCSDINEVCSNEQYSTEYCVFKEKFYKNLDTFTYNCKIW